MCVQILFVVTGVLFAEGWSVSEEVSHCLCSEGFSSFIRGGESTSS